MRNVNLRRGLNRLFLALWALWGVAVVALLWLLSPAERDLLPHQSMWLVDTDRGKVRVVLDSQPTADRAKDLIDEKVAAGQYEAYQPYFRESLKQPWTWGVLLGIPAATYGALFCLGMLAAWIWRGFSAGQ